VIRVLHSGHHPGVPPVIDNALLVGRCVIAFAAFILFLVCLDWVVARLFGRQNSMFRS